MHSNKCVLSSSLFYKLSVKVDGTAELYTGGQLGQS